MSDNSNENIQFNKRTQWISGIAISLALMLFWFFGSISPDSIVWWLVIAALLNIGTGVSACLQGLTYPLTMMVIADFIFYLWVELDAPNAMNPFVFYGVFLAIFFSSTTCYWLRHHKSRNWLLTLAIADLVLNAVFCVLDLTIAEIQ